ncbi:YfcC family protein [Emergencia sp.]|uniref:YfcC family protein n=1 Tax=Emergencia sp. TaxID=1926557 RepID=UPI003AF1725A
MEKKKRKLSVPHTYVIIGIILVIVTLMTYVIPAGQYDRVMDEASDQEIIVTGSYHHVKQTPVGPFKMVTALAKGMVDASDIIFFCFFAYGLVYMMIKTGAFYGGVSALKRVMRGKEILILPVFMIVFGICGSTFGMYEEVYGLLPAFIGIAIAMGYDGLVGGATVVLGVVTGFAAATLNPFTIGIAQGIAGLPIGSGVWYRIICLVLFEALAIWYVMRYAHRVKKNPSLSIVRDVHFNVDEGMTSEKMEQLPFTGRHKLIMLVFVCTIGLLVYGTTQFGWYLSELSALFIIAMFVVGLLGGFGPSEICRKFVEAASEILFGAVVIGVARSLVVVMNEGNIIDSLVYYMSSALTDVPNGIAAVGMVIVQNILNFFIPSGSGQAAVSMPIMANLADSIGMHRQIAVLAFQFGDGFSNMFWPTVIATECGIMGIPLQKWYKFAWPLFIMMFALQVVLIVVATMIGYQ